MARTVIAYIWVCISGCFVNRIGIIANSDFFSAWVEEFYGNSQAEQDMAYHASQILFLSGHVLTIPGSFLIGLIADRLRFGITIPLCFAISGAFLFCLQFSHSALGVLTFVCTIGGSLFLVFEVLLLSTLMTKCVPQESKGTLLGLFTWAGSIGVLVASKAGGALYDIDKNLTFIAAAGVTGVYATVILLMTLCGLFKH